MHFLVTAGATREPLDAVRFLSNVSTGSTGAALADALAVRGHTVTLLRGEGASEPGASRLEVALDASKNIIASRLNLTPQHFSRILHELTVAGLIEVEGRTIRILDTDRLRQFEM